MVCIVLIQAADGYGVAPPPSLWLHRPARHGHQPLVRTLFNRSQRDRRL